MVATPTQNDLDILARTLYGEARDQGFNGMIAVGAVIMNRMATGEWGHSVSSVCLAPRQFSCWNGGDSNSEQVRSGNLRETQAKNEAYQAAWQILSRQYQDPTGGSTYYYMNSIPAPSWSRDMHETTQIGQHIFFRPPGTLERIGNWFRHTAGSAENSASQKWHGAVQDFHGAVTNAEYDISNSSIGQGAKHGIGMLSAFIASHYRKKSYVWGGKDAQAQGGLDCSGFVSDVFKKLFNVTIDGAASGMAQEIAGKFKLPCGPYNGSIPMYSVISVHYPNGTGHVVMVMPDETGQQVVWESEGNSRNTSDNPGKGVTKLSLASFLSRSLIRESSLTVTDTTKIFSGLSNGMILTSQMMMGAWQADDATKQATLKQTLTDSALDNTRVKLNFTNALGGYPFLNRSTFMTDTRGRKILDVAAGMSENWTKYSVVIHIAHLQHVDPTRAIERLAIKSPSFTNFLRSLDENYGYQGLVQKVDSRRALGGQEVNFASDSSELTSSTGGRISPAALENLQQRVASLQNQIQRMSRNPVLGN